jgi:hypothetical protein
MPTCKCGKEVDDWRGARGHVQFTSGDGHGDHSEVPDNWRADLFGEAPDEDDDEGGQQDGDDADEGEADPTPDEPEESDSGQSDGSQEKGRIWRILTTPLDELIGGSE